MARPETLIPGNCYFSVGFYDNDLVLPMIDTLVYVGQETDQDEGRLWLFKEPESPSSPDEQDPSSEPPALIAFSDSQLHEIVDFDGLMQRLREIARESANVRPEYRLSSYGPSLDLLREVCARGRWDEGLKYLRGWENAWDHPRLREWIAAVEERRLPGSEESS